MLEASCDDDSGVVRAPLQQGRKTVGVNKSTTLLRALGDRGGGIIGAARRGVDFMTCRAVMHLLELGEVVWTKPEYALFMSVCLQRVVEFCLRACSDEDVQ